VLSNKSIFLNSTIASIGITGIEAAMPSLALLSRATLSRALISRMRALARRHQGKGKDGGIPRCNLQMMPRPRMRRSPNGKSKRLTRT
jgi:hypothetical protein